MKTTIWMWIIEDETSDLCGEEFFTELNTHRYKEHKKYAQSLFPGLVLKSCGTVDEEEAEALGYDTY